MNDDATGLGHGEASPAAAGGPEAPRAGVNRYILVAVLFIGTVVAVGGTWVASRDAETPIQGLAPPAGSQAPVSHSARAVDCRRPFSAEPGGISPDRSPEITDITALDRTTVRVRWVDRSYGRANFIVARVCENGRTINGYLVRQPDTEYVFRGLDPATAPYCFRVEAVTTDSDWRSHERCISPPG